MNRSTRGIRAARKAESRIKILHAAADLFQAHSWEAITLRQIASAAGLSTGAVFANFDSKDQLLDVMLAANPQALNTALHRLLDRAESLVACAQSTAKAAHMMADRLGQLAIHLRQTEAA